MLFIPGNCIGNRPHVCRTGPIHTDGHYTCERGVLNGDTALRDTCLVQITKYSGTIIHEVYPGTYTISTTGETYFRQCSGERETAFNLNRGVYLLTVPARCTLTGDHWNLRGLLTSTNNITIQTDIIAITPFNWTFDIVPVHHNVISFNDWTPLKELREENLDYIKTIDNYIQWRHEIHIPWLIVCVIVAVVTIVVIRIYCSRKCKACKITKVKQPEILPQRDNRTQCIELKEALKEANIQCDVNDTTSV